MKEMDTEALLSSLREMTEAGHTVSLVITGDSMTPFLIHHRDAVWFCRPDRALKRGDVVFYQRDNGHYVMHRIVRLEKTDGGAPRYGLAGDNQSVIEHGIRPDQIFGLVTQVRRKGRLLRPGSFWWGFFARVWPLLLPLRRPILRLYTALSGKRPAARR